MRKAILLSLSFLIVVGAAAAGVVTWVHHEKYISTDNAKVSADTATVVVPKSGLVTKWSVEVGDTVEVGDKLGYEAAQATEEDAKTKDPRLAASKANQSMRLRNPSLMKAQLALKAKTAKPEKISLPSTLDGTVIGTSGQKGLVVAKGTPLALIADLKHPYIVAYIDEEDIEDVDKGQEVDVTLDADKGETFTGTVDEIGYEAGNKMTQQAIDNKASQGNKDRETQRVPVRIEVDELDNQFAIPGLNATVKIHK
ncbi:HlyD family secretion protein [Marininema halotolerans]|uniref:HlyD membrane-fusion protein of T1SS n=1 Tax=Marininema halotolerans TaxID=1155944 RepID=A0A1I6TIU1_9BACL|nr:HlyD family efflux transporter periplasmic adaptor subunit [Marininema halotolerans]SFS89095.1 HlyD membrane-fusion protein of T1SS [Marininema halotolerans]